MVSSDVTSDVAWDGVAFTLTMLFCLMGCSCFAFENGNKNTMLKSSAIKEVIRAVRPSSIPLNSQTRPDVATPNTPTNANTVPSMNLGLKTYCDFLKNLLLSSNGLRKTTFRTPSIIAIDRIYFGNVNGLETKTWTRAEGCCASTIEAIGTPTNKWQKRSLNRAGHRHPKPTPSLFLGFKTGR